MSYMIVSDSSSNILHSTEENYRTVPLHILLDGEDWADTPDLDLSLFDAALDSFRGKASTSCPSPDEWFHAFEDAETVFCFTISHNLSGSYNAALTAKSMYEEQYPDRKVYVMDSLATGPTMVLMMNYLKRQLANGVDPETAYTKTLKYQESTACMFTLQSIQMLANAGRVSPLIAKAVGLLDVRMIGKASEVGTIELVDKARGYKKSLMSTFKNMLNLGYAGGRLIISHDRNEQIANELVALAREKFGDVMVDIHRTTALCSFYAEKGGIIVSFEKGSEAFE